MNAKTRGRLVVFEGPDGCGKSTQLALLGDALRAEGEDVLCTREPTDGEWGRRLREMLRSGETISAQEELRWFTLDRAEHVGELIEPALAAGTTVLCDRYFLSTVAYQGAHGLDWREILADQEGRFPTPDIALVFVLDAAESLARIAARGGPKEPAFEERSFQQRVAAVYAEIDRPYVVRLAATGSLEAVAERVRRALQ